MEPGHVQPASPQPAMEHGHFQPASPQPAMEPGQVQPASPQPAMEPGHFQPASPQPAMEHGHFQPASPQPAMEPGHAQPLPVPVQPWEYSLRKYLLLLAALVVTVTYTAGFNPPGGVWQEDPHNGQPAGDPIIRYTHYRRYLAFLYCNATAFAASLVVIVLILVLAIRHDKKGKDSRWVVMPLRGVMVVDLLSLIVAYGAGTCRDKVSTIYSAVLVAVVFLYVAVLKLVDRCCPDNSSDPSTDANSSNGSGSGSAPTTNITSGPGYGSTMTMPNSSNGAGGTMPTTTLDFGADVIPAPVPNSDPDVDAQEKQAREKLKAKERLCKVLMLLATFAVSITYVAGLNMPGGFWDTTGGSHHPGDAILRDKHGLRLTVFLLCNTTAFVASLSITMLLIIDGKKLRKNTARSRVLYGCIVVALVGLIGSYAAGSCRETDTTVYVVSLVDM